MSENNQPNSIRDNILKSIEAGRVTMKPKWHFVLRTSLLVIGIVLAVLALLYLISFIIFILHQTGSWFVPAFGMRGLTEFLLSFPWLMFVLAGLFILVLEILVRRYSFGYRKPLLYTILGIVVLVGAGGFIVAQTSFHRGLFDQARLEHLPFGGSLYREYGTPHRDNVVIGSITAIQADGYILQDRRDEIFQIITSDDTEYANDDDIQVGDSIVVFGNRDSNSIQALNIREIYGTEPPPPPHLNHY